MLRLRGSALAVAVAGLLALGVALGGAATATTAASGVKGDPQPELKPFSLGVSGYAGGSVALEPNGTLVTARGYTKGNGYIVVCVLSRGAAKCASSATLSPLSGDSLYGVPQVFIPSANHVVVLMDACCDASADGSDLLFSSVNGGKTFAAPVRVGTLGVSAAALIGGNVVFTSGDDTTGAEVESIPAGAAGPPAETAVATTEEAFDVGVGSYKSGALIASDFDGADYTTYVAYAPAGENFDLSASYARVGSFPHERLIGMSGDALLTVQTTGKEWALLRIFNGKTFGPAHEVPGTSGGGAEWFYVSGDPSGRVHVFSERAAAGYELTEVTTSTGASWSGALKLGDAVASDSFSAALDSSGTGLVMGTGPAAAATGYPLLAGQGVSFALKSASIAKGKTTTASGGGGPVAKGRAVELQVERSGLWYTVATAHEGSTGKFAFTIKGGATGTYDYRAVIVDWAGYVQYGYSAARALKVVK